MKHSFCDPIAWLAGCWIVLLSVEAFAQPPADVLLHGGRIVTVDTEFRIVQAMAIRGQRIVAIGDDDDRMRAWVGEATEVIDLEDRMVLPGLIDSHTHPSGASLFEADHEIPSMDTIADVLSYVRRRADVVPHGEWIKLSQVFITRLREQRYPTRAELDEAAPNHPVLFRTGPDGSANSIALQRNGIDRDFAARHPMNVMVDPQTGEPNGILRDIAAVTKSIPDANASQLTTTERDERLIDLFDDYNRSGITAVIDRNCSDLVRSQYGRLLRDGKLNVRVGMSRSLDPRAGSEDVEQRLDAIANDSRFQSPDPRLRVIGVKCFLDGGMLTGSAFFKRPWGLSTIYGIDDPNYRGMRYIESDGLEQMVRACVQRDLAFTAHCQGDAAVEALLGVYDVVNRETPVAPTRSSITHSSFMSEKAVADAARIGVGVDLQPAWLYLDARTLIEQFGKERLKYFIPLRSLMDAGVVAGGGSDHMQKIGSLRSVNPYNPFLGMWIALTRAARWHDDPVSPEQALTRQQMIRFYTINNAWLMRMESEIGSLEVGKRADFIVIDRDLLSCDADEGPLDTRHVDMARRAAADKSRSDESTHAVGLAQKSG